MKLPVIFSSRFTILLLLFLAGMIVAGVAGEGLSGQVIQGKSGNPMVDDPLLDTLGISAADQQILTQKAKEISDNYKSIKTVEKPALSATGNYVENSMEKITTSNGKPFEGGTSIDYTITPDNKVSGTVKFLFVEQGWTIKVPGTVTGSLSPDTGKLVIKSTDASVKYSGKQYPLTMTINAQYDGSGFVGTKELSMAGTTGTLGFQSKPA